MSGGIPFVRQQLRHIRDQVDEMLYQFNAEDVGEPSPEHIDSVYASACLAITRALQEIDGLEFEKDDQRRAERASATGSAS